MPRGRTKTSSPKQRASRASTAETEKQKLPDAEGAPRRSARMAARSDASPASGEASRSRRSSTAAQTAASVAEARMTRSRGTREDSSSPASDGRTRSGVRESPVESPATRVKMSRRSTSKVNYEESDGEEDAAAAVTKGEEEEYRTEDDSEIESENEKPTRTRTRSRSSPRSPPKGQRGRGRPPVKGKKRASKAEDDDEEGKRESGDVSVRPVAPTRTRYGRESKRVKQDDEPDGANRVRPSRASPRGSAAAAAKPASRSVRSRRKGETAASPAGARDEPPSRRSARVGSKRAKETKMDRDEEARSEDDGSVEDVEMQEEEILDAKVAAAATDKRKLSAEAELEEEKPAKRPKYDAPTSETDEVPDKGDGADVPSEEKLRESEHVQNETEPRESKETTSKKTDVTEKGENGQDSALSEVSKGDFGAEAAVVEAEATESEAKPEPTAGETGTSASPVSEPVRAPSPERRDPGAVETTESSDAEDSVLGAEREGIKNGDLDGTTGVKAEDAVEGQSDRNTTEREPSSKLEPPPSESDKENTGISKDKSETELAAPSEAESRKDFEEEPYEFDADVANQKRAFRTDVLAPSPAVDVAPPKEEEPDPSDGAAGTRAVEDKTEVTASADVATGRSADKQMSPEAPRPDENADKDDPYDLSLESKSSSRYAESRAVPSYSPEEPTLPASRSMPEIEPVESLGLATRQESLPTKEENQSPQLPSKTIASELFVTSARMPVPPNQDCPVTPESHPVVSSQIFPASRGAKFEPVSETGHSPRTPAEESAERSIEAEDAPGAAETETPDDEPMDVDPPDVADGASKTDDAENLVRNNGPSEDADGYSARNGSGIWRNEALVQERSAVLDDGDTGTSIPEACPKTNGTNSTLDMKDCNNVAEHATAPSGRNYVAEHGTAPSGRNYIAEHGTAPSGRNYIAVPDLGDQTRASLKDRTFRLVSHCFGSNVSDLFLQCDKLLSEVRNLDVDILCLQNVHEAHCVQKLEQSLHALGYQSVVGASEGQSTRLGTYYRSASFRLVSQASVSLRSLIDKDLEASSLDVGDKSAVRTFLQMCGQILFARLTSVSADKTLTVANVHIPLTDVSTHALQTSCLVRELVTMGEGVQSPHVLCGVFNTAEEGPAYQLLRDGYLSNEMIEELQCRKEVPLPGKENVALVNLLWKAFQHPSSGLQSCYASVMGHEVQRFGGDGKVHVSPDLLWFSSDTLRVLGVLDAECHTLQRAVLKADLAFLN